VSIAGDVDGNGLVDARDLLYFGTCWGAPADSQNALCDVNGDLQIDAKDLLLLIQNGSEFYSERHTPMEKDSMKPYRRFQIRLTLVTLVLTMSAICSAESLPEPGKAEGELRDASSQTGFYPTGFRGWTSEERAWLDKNARKVAPPDAREIKNLPASVKNVDYLPAVGSQSWGSCSVWASVYYYKTWQEAREHGLAAPRFPR